MVQTWARSPPPCSDTIWSLVLNFLHSPLNRKWWSANFLQNWDSVRSMWTASLKQAIFSANSSQLTPFSYNSCQNCLVSLFYCWSISFPSNLKHYWNVSFHQICVKYTIQMFPSIKSRYSIETLPSVKFESITLSRCFLMPKKSQPLYRDIFFWQSESVTLSRCFLLAIWLSHSYRDIFLWQIWLSHSIEMFSYDQFDSEILLECFLFSP